MTKLNLVHKYHIQNGSAPFGARIVCPVRSVATS